MAVLNRADRVEAALSGEGLDRVPISIWWRDRRREWSARDLTAATLAAYERYGWDYVKITPRPSYCVEDWGAIYPPGGVPGHRRGLAETPVRVPSDLQNLDLLRFDRGALDEHLQVVRAVARALGRGTPLLQTVYAPLAILDLLIGDAATLQEWIETEPRHVRTGLEAIGETYLAYARETIEAGATGLFFTTGRWASRATLLEEAYREFGVPADRRVLEAVAGERFNVLHLGGADVPIALAADYPVRALCWDPRAGQNPSLDEARDSLKDAVALMGGLPAGTLLDGSPAEVEKAAREAIERSDRYRLLLAPDAGLTDPPPDEICLALADFAARL